MLLKNIFDSRTCFAPDEGGGSAVHDGTEDVVREDATVNGGGDPGEETEDDSAGTGTGDDEAGGTETEDAGADAGTEDLASLLQAAGLPTDPRQFMASLTQLRQQAAESRQLQAMLWQQTQQARQQQAPPPKEPEKPKLPWEVPAFDRGMLQMLMTDENGNIVPKPGADPTLGDQYRKWHAARESALDQLLKDPYGTLQGGIMPLIQQEAQRIYQQQEQQRRYQEQAATVNRRVAELSKNKDFVDPLTGAPTAVGNFWNQHFFEAQQFGHPNPAKYADSMLDAELFRFQAQQQAEDAANAPPPPTPAEKQQQEKLAFLKGRQQPSRGGSMRRANGKKSPAQDYDPFKKLREDLSQLDPAEFRKN